MVVFLALCSHGRNQASTWAIVVFHMLCGNGRVLGENVGLNGLFLSASIRRHGIAFFTFLPPTLQKIDKSQ